MQTLSVGSGDTLVDSSLKIHILDSPWPARELTGLPGGKRTAWMDMPALPLDEQKIAEVHAVDKSFADSVDWLLEQVDSNVNFDKGERVVLAGFSQGAAVALSAALKTKNSRAVAAVLNIGGWFVKDYHLQAEENLFGRPPAFSLFWLHGKKDFPIPVALSDVGKRWLVGEFQLPEQNVFGDQPEGMGHSPEDQNRLPASVTEWLAEVMRGRKEELRG